MTLNSHSSGISKRVISGRLFIHVQSQVVIMESWYKLLNVLNY